MMKERNREKIPSKLESARGLVEKPRIPSIEYKKSFQNDHFVVPADRSTFLNSNHFVLNPTHGKIPFENLFFSQIDRTESTYFPEITCTTHNFNICEHCHDSVKAACEE